MYFLIGTHVLPVLENGGRDQTMFGIVAGCGFALGALLLLVAKHRIVWVLGAALQVAVIMIYFKVAPDRTPHYEVWGLTLRVPQVLILGALAYLSFSRFPARRQTVSAR
jgi:hypothetical protein